MGKPRIYESVEEFDSQVDAYFQEIEEENKASMKKFGKLCRAPNIAGLCIYMGIHKDTFYEYAKRTDSNNNRYADSVKNASERLESYKLEKAAVGQLKEITTIFDLKNNHGYTDKQEQVNINKEQNKLSLDDIDKLEKE